ncbi:hypothetical protein LTR28_003994 [Elasticomyces elasticus]|nr:hypothetical protein LTR28_003994 [Elasticomyces elasticus]
MATSRLLAAAVATLGDVRSAETEDVGTRKATKTAMFVEKTRRKSILYVDHSSKLETDNLSCLFGGSGWAAMIVSRSSWLAAQKSTCLSTVGEQPRSVSAKLVLNKVGLEPAVVKRPSSRASVLVVTRVELDIPAWLSILRGRMLSDCDAENYEVCRWMWEVLIRHEKRRLGRPGMSGCARIMLVEEE